MAMPLPPEVMAAVAGAAGGAAPQPAAGDPMAGGGIPPEMLAMADQMATQATNEQLGPPEADPEGSLYGGAGGENTEALREALDLLKQYAEAEDDEGHIQTVLKVLATLQKILVDEQRGQEDLLAGKMNPSALRSALRG